MTLAIAVPGCPGPLAPVCAVAGGVGSTVVGAGASAVLSAMAGWVVTGSSWLLDQIGSVLSSSTHVDVRASWFTGHYAAMSTIGAALLLPMLLVSVVQAVYRQSPAVVVRSALVNLPLAALLTGIAVQLVQLSLAATDALCSTISAGSGSDVERALHGLADVMVQQAAGGPGSVPLFVVLLVALLVAGGSLALWLELLVRAAAVYVAVLFLPLGLASLVWPAVTHWCRRLVDTLVALVLSKFVMVAILTLAAGALASGTSAGFSAVLAGGALLLLAAFAPFVLLRLVPAVEAGAVHQLEGTRQRLRQAAAGPLPRSAAAHALRGLQEARRPGLDTGEPGLVGGGELAALGAAGPSAIGASSGVGDHGPDAAPGSASTSGGGAAEGGGSGLGVADLPGQPASDQAFWETVRGVRPPHRSPDGTIPGITGAPLWSTDEPGGEDPGGGGGGGGGESPGGSSPLLEPSTFGPTEWEGGFADGGWDGTSRRAVEEAGDGE